MNNFSHNPPARPNPETSLHYSDQALTSSVNLRLDAFVPMNVVTGEAGQQVFYPMDVQDEPVNRFGSHGSRVIMLGRLVSPDTVEEFDRMNIPVPADAGSLAEVTATISQRGRLARAVSRLVNRAQVDPMIPLSITVQVPGHTRSEHHQD